MRAQGRLTSPEEFEQIVVRETPDGGIVRVQDVARVELGSQDYSVDRPPERQAQRRSSPSTSCPDRNAVDAADGVEEADGGS